MAVSVLMVRALFDELQSRGHDTEPLLALCHLSREQLGDIRCRVPSELFAPVVERAVAISGDPAIGLSLGSRTPESVLQAIGYLVLSSSSLRAACETAFRYGAVLSDALSWELREQGESAALSFQCATVTPAGRLIANDWVLSFSYRILRYFAPRGSETSEASSIALEVGHARPIYCGAYPRFFGPSEVRFGAKANTLTFPRAWLDLPHLHGDRITGEALRAVAEDLLQARNMQTGLADRLRLLLRQYPDLGVLDAAAVARLAGIGESSLRRQLAGEGTSPLALLDEARCTQACNVLRRPGASIKELASELGYADISSFHRAFKRWKGCTPANYRSSAIGGDS